MRNVEFKAELRDVSIAHAVARSLNAARIAAVEQTDTYYRTFSGRLKKRETIADGSPQPTEYIHYERDNRTRPKLSNFRIMDEEEFLERYGTQPLAVWLVVHKARIVYFQGHTRIHIDEVRGLGNFLEFETLVSKACNIARAHQEIEDLRTAFGPVLGEPISVGYSDLLDDQSAATTPNTDHENQTG